ncbi:MAG: bifunctional glutamate N-acetyltransferase/amino-acid acetyltransferase ArgJ [Proteobacteria bacterium]|nr:bifunctional glutamate N-acetyltransferase/amino-acid acetyltransferase ArgJ [Pseudomonadota bacterium]
MDLKISPLAPERFPEMPAIAGLRLAVAESGLKYQGRPDLLLAAFAPGTTVAGVLTQSSAPGAPVQWCREHLGAGIARALVVNAGNANVFTGAKGRVAVEAMAAASASAVGCRPAEVMIASTGVIGEPLEHEKITAEIAKLPARFGLNDWELAAKAISTTDTFTKGACVTAEIAGVPVNIVGIAKGSGMIAPDMATMLAFVFTDAKLDAAVLQPMLKRNADTTFNSITVDGDTSTSDTLLLFATGQADPHPVPVDHRDPLLRGFEKALHSVLKDLAIQVARDGEGAQKLIQINVTGAASKRAARKIGLAIANSPLVKTAVAGEDANWGRVVMAVGKSGEKADRDAMSVAFGGIEIARDGARVEDFDEAAAHMTGREVLIETDVGVGRGKATVWTCDLTHGYININADYRS